MRKLKTDKTFGSTLKPSRLAQRATTEKKRILEVLNETLFCTISFADKSKPYSITTGFCLLKERMYVHGSVKSHFLKQIKIREVCISTFLFDGLVLAGSAFHHSVNYRSVVAFSKAEEVNEEAKKLEVLEGFTNRYIPGRWKELRPPTDAEMKATAVFSFDLNRASLKERNGPPSFAESDYYENLWTGVIPTRQVWEEPIPDPKMNPKICCPQYFIKTKNEEQ